MPPLTQQSKAVMKAITLIIAVLFLSACEPPERWKVDKNLQKDLFFECMNSLPAGPNETVYNDWDEVVEECRYTAYLLAKRCVKNCD